MSPVLCAIMTAATLAKGSKDWVSSMRRSIVVSHCVDHYPFRSRYGKRARRRGGSRPGRARATARPSGLSSAGSAGPPARPRDGPDPPGACWRLCKYGPAGFVISGSVKGPRAKLQQPERGKTPR